MCSFGFFSTALLNSCMMGSSGKTSASAFFMMSSRHSFSTSGFCGNQPPMRNGYRRFRLLVGFFGVRSHRCCFMPNTEYTTGAMAKSNSLSTAHAACDSFYSINLYLLQFIPTSASAIIAGAQRCRSSGRLTRHLRAPSLSRATSSSHAHIVHPIKTSSLSKMVAKNSTLQHRDGAVSLSRLTGANESEYSRIM